jgi:hypothetical protein
MTGYYEDPWPRRTVLRDRFRRDAVALVGMQVRPSDHFTRLWPTRPDQRPDAPFFLAAMLPLRLAALALLWLTSSPGRFTVAVVLVLAAVLAH